MSRLGNSFIRGFGATLGSFAARSLVTSASTVSVGYDAELQNVEKKSTITTWKILGILFVLLLILGGPIGFVIFLPCAIVIPIVNLFIARSKRKKAEEVIRKNLNIAIDDAVKEAKDNGIILEIPNTAQMSIYYLEELSIDIIRISNKKIKLKDKYNDSECLENIMSENPWMGMSVENLKDIKGNPSSYEISENSKTKTEVLLYGANKWSGDVFTFKNDILTEFKDR